MPPMQTIDQLIVDPHYSVFREVVAPTLRSRVGGGAMQVRRLYERPIYQFRLRAAQETKAQAEALYGFYLYHQGDIPFWFGGKEWGTVATPILTAFGNGTQTQFFLHNRNITGSLQVYLNGVLADPQPSLTASSGMITFASAPGADVKITASYTCRYKCVFHSEDDVLLTEEEFYRQLFRYEGLVLRELVP
jgi:hypothetical protein